MFIEWIGMRLRKARRGLWKRVPFTATQAQRAAKALEDEAAWTDVSTAKGAQHYAQLRSTIDSLRQMHVGQKLAPPIIDGLWAFVQNGTLGKWVEFLVTIFIFAHLANGCSGH